MRLILYYNPPNKTEMLSECLKHSMYEAGSTVVEQGEGGDGMYFISRGKLSVSIDDVVVKIIKDGDFFGEVALFYDTPRTATVTAESHSHLFALSKEDFVNVATQFPLENNVIKKMAENRFYDFVLSILVKKVPLFASASVAFLNDLLRKLESKMYNSGEVVINQDDTGEEMYFVSRGELDICVNGKNGLNLFHSSFVFLKIIKQNNSKQSILLKTVISLVR